MTDYSISHDAGEYSAVNAVEVSLLKQYLIEAFWDGSGFWLDTEGNPILDTEGYPIIVYDHLYKIVPVATGLSPSHPISVEAGVIVLTGINNSLLPRYNLITTLGSYHHSGRLITGGWQRVFSSEVGSLLLDADVDVNLSQTRNLLNSIGNYILNGSDVRFVPSVVVVTSGSYLLTGQIITPIISYILTGVTESYATAGTDPSLYRGQVIVPWAGEHLTSGVNAVLGKFSGYNFDSGSYFLSGEVNNLKRAHVLDSLSDSYIFEGTTLDLLKSWVLSAITDSYETSGEVITFSSFYYANVEADSYVITGEALTFGSEYLAYLRTGLLTLTGRALVFSYSAERIGNILLLFDIRPVQLSLEAKSFSTFLSLGSSDLTLSLTERNFS